MELNSEIHGKNTFQQRIIKEVSKTVEESDLAGRCPNSALNTYGLGPTWAKTEGLIIPRSFLTPCNLRQGQMKKYFFIFLLCH